MVGVLESPLIVKLIYGKPNVRYYCMMLVSRVTAYLPMLDDTLVYTTFVITLYFDVKLSIAEGTSPITILNYSPDMFLNTAIDAAAALIEACCAVSYTPIENSYAS